MFAGRNGDSGSGFGSRDVTYLSIIVILISVIALLLLCFILFLYKVYFRSASKRRKRYDVTSQQQSSISEYRATHNYFHGGIGLNTLEVPANKLHNGSASAFVNSGLTRKHLFGDEHAQRRCVTTLHG